MYPALFDRVHIPVAAFHVVIITTCYVIWSALNVWSLSVPREVTYLSLPRRSRMTSRPLWLETA